ncbi:hypothetical protein [Sulfitobacter pontiacus]|jgi:hypothetical protein|uniref:hypothetical protein n=1 Tax=Sulfitobacter pontiacus TaxID=60137 RepID=UPI0016172895|nr:hypothetical protein [Sulfitobacter pontiacus]GLO80274.1 hypothetical protein MACH23_36950 [Sulfitobacter pontiacus]
MHDTVHEEVHHGHTIRIYHDEDAESPRDWCNLGTMVCWHRRYTLGDDHRFGDPHAFLCDLAGCADETDHSFRRLMELAQKRAVILPVYLYDHSGLAMNTTGFHCPWDSGQVGFVYVTLDDVRKEFGVTRVSKKLRARVEEMLRSEVEAYDDFLGGRIYGYTVALDGEEVDACWGYVGAFEKQCLPEARAVIPHPGPLRSIEQNGAATPRRAQAG